MNKHDTFLAKIHNILLEFAEGKREQGFKDVLLREIQDYSRKIEGKEEVSQIFLNLCDLILDCKIKSLPDNYFKLITANLVNKYSQTSSSIVEISKLTGLNPLELSEALQELENLDCLSSTFGKDSNIKPGKNVGKRKTGSPLREVEEIET